MWGEPTGIQLLLVASQKLAQAKLQQYFRKINIFIGCSFE
jgi:hypothetical protein